MKNDKNKTRKKQNRFLLILPYLGILAVAAALIVAVVIVTSRREGNDRNIIPTLGDLTEAATQAEPDISEAQEETRGDQLNEEGETSEISELVSRYFEAIKNADVESLETIIRPADAHESEEVMKKKAQRSEGYLNIQCYSLPGPAENSYIVYVYYEEKYINIETPAPAMNRFYICRAEDGSYYIDKNARTQEYTDYLAEISQRDDVVSLIDVVNIRLKQALDADPNLNEFMNKISSSQPETTAAATSGE